jgi:hypothetical protein
MSFLEWGKRRTQEVVGLMQGFKVEAKAPEVGTHSSEIQEVSIRAFFRMARTAPPPRKVSRAHEYSSSSSKKKWSF